MSFFFRRTWRTSPLNRSGWHQVPLAFFNTDTADGGQRCPVSAEAVCDRGGHYTRTLGDINRDEQKGQNSNGSSRVLVTRQRRVYLRNARTTVARASRRVTDGGETMLSRKTTAAVWHTEHALIVFILFICCCCCYYYYYYYCYCYYYYCYYCEKENQRAEHGGRGSVLEFRNFP